MTWSATEPWLSIPAGSTATTTTTTALDNERLRLNHVLVVLAAAGTTAGVVQLQGSLDGSNWVQLGTTVTLTAAGTSLVSVSGIPMRFVRGVISTTVVGGSVTGWVTSAGVDGS